ncbi:MAG: hypothetical protein P8127_17735 [Acidobacteriota bacterium]
MILRLRVLRLALCVVTMGLATLSHPSTATAQHALRPSAIRLPNSEVGAVPITKSSGAWITLMTEGFEGSFPTGDWFVFDYDGSFNGEYVWASDDFKPFNGIYSALPAAGGADATDPDLADYPNNCWTWMIYGPFDLSDSSVLATRELRSLELRWRGIRLDSIHFPE